MRSTLGAVRRRGKWESELDEELRGHLELRAADLVRGGLTPAAAARQARLELGASEAWKEQCRAAHGLRWLDQLRQDLRFAGRMLRRGPGFTAVAVLSLALGVGANTVAFSVVNSLLLKPLAIASPASVFTVEDRRFPTQSFPNYRDLRDRNTIFAGLAAYRQAPMGVETADGARRVWGYLATGNYFDLLGIRPLRGRFFHAEDDRLPGASPFAVLSYACWHNRFAADPRIVGKTVRINSLSYSVLGVAPPEFHGTELFYWPEIWVPMMMQPQIEGHSWLDQRATFNCLLIGRLAPGVTPVRAAANLRALGADLVHETPTWNEGIGLRLAQPGLVGNALRDPMRAFTGGVMALAGLALLAACANLASLLAARATDRHRELAIRLSIGAGRGRIVRQLLAESALLALLGGAAACGLAAVLLRLLSQWRAPLDFPVRFEVDPDARVFAFAFAASLVSGLLFSIGPARQTLSADLNQALKGGSAGGSAHRRARRGRGFRRTGRAGPAGWWPVRDLLLAAQVALCCLLVTACLVALRGLARTFSLPLGFEPRGVAVASLDLGLAGYDAARCAAFQRRALEAASRLPGVAAAGYGNSLPLSIDQSSNMVFRAETTDFRLAQGKTATVYQISPGYLGALGARLLAGRDFTWHDDARSPLVAIVNQAFARQVLGRPNAVGMRFRAGQGPLIEVAGQVEDGRYVSITEAPRPAFFRPILQQPNETTVLVVRSALPAGEMAQQLRQAIAALDPRLPIYGLGSLRQMLGFALLPARAASIALGAFGLLALMLAATGIYGLASYSVSRRTREIGIRVAVGARPAQVLRFVLGRTALLLVVGSAAGLALGFGATKLLTSIVYLASPHDPLVLAAAALVMVAVGVAAASAPAHRALDVDPVRALRQE
ncbi:MAG TPA: ABC transporter permease [Thermoanaerobaculia bacterium]|nr:ABC transporter permease [Thermoanaerobaculia bacterium]